MSLAKLQARCNAEKIMDVIKLDPHATPRYIAKTTGIAHQVVRDTLKELTSDIFERDADAFIVLRDRYLYEIEQDKQYCQRRFEACSNPTTGSRWIEEKRKLRDSQIRLLGLDAPSRQQIDIGVTVTKQHRDEIFKAAQMDIIDGEIVLPEIEYDAPDEISSEISDEIVEEV